MSWAPGSCRRPGTASNARPSGASPPPPRRAWRRSWSSPSSRRAPSTSIAERRSGRLGPTRLLFVIGATANASVQAAVDEEMAQYNDIIQNNIHDSYRNLTHKTIAWLSWAVSRCPHVPIALKVDDDVVVNPFNLQKQYHSMNQETISQRNKGKEAVGKIYGRIILAPAQRKGRWALTKEEYPGNYFPPYATGAAYFIDNVALKKLWEHVTLAPFLWIEDVFLTGMVARVAEVEHGWLNRLYLEEKLTKSLYKGNAIFLFEASPWEAQWAWDRISKKT
ncbi:hypothetical protein C7M84_003935 [Penaeus vannamei]|uniref:Hexosyltransferase n=1 Tax=Penaeus vannamei TaxID=6689 RepID=A0A423TLS8_PENVA|nr:hypothetical protein C7M84_003935 [Penaeus vannamei]